MRSSWLPAVALMLAAGVSRAAGSSTTMAEPVPAAEQIVTAILIEGTAVVKPADVSARIKTRIGASLTRDTLRDDVKAIWAMGRFEDVAVDVTSDAGGVRVTFLVKERPVIREVRFKGAKELSDKDLRDAVPLKDGDVFDPVKLKQGEQHLLRSYREKGYPDAAVAGELVPAEKDPGKSDLVIGVTEGVKMKITQIAFTGNRLYPASALKKVLKNKEAAFFFQSGLFLKDELDRDRERIAAFYKDEGYQKARVQAAVVTPDPKKPKDHVHLAFAVTEGTLYHVSELAFAGGGLASEKEMRDKLSVGPGDKLSQRRLDEGLGRIRDIYTTRGYIYAAVEPEITFDDRAAEARVVIRLREGTLASISRVLVRGNDETKDKVVLREVLVKPGEVFDTDKIRRSQERVYNLGFFEDVKVYTEPSLESGKEHLIFDVKERQTGTISLGGGFSSQYGLVGFLQLTKANLFGLGIRVSAEWEIGSSRNSKQIDYFDPWFWDSPISLGIGYWDTQRDLLRSYSEKATGVSTEFGYRFWDNWRATLGYKFEVSQVKVSDAAAYDPPLHTSSPSLSLSYDTRDNIFDPYRGWSHRLVGQVSGGPLPEFDILGGDTKFYKVIYDASDFELSPVRMLPFIKAPSLALHSRFGRSWGFGGQEVPITERFFLGGTDSIRGYGERELSGSLTATGGGVVMWQFNAEMKWPLVTRVLTLALPFYDIGNTWDQWNVPTSIDAINAPAFPLAQSWGFGVRLTIPGTIIVIRLDYGWGLTRIYDPSPSGNLHFNIGNIF